MYLFMLFFYCSASQLLVNLILFDHRVDILHLEKHHKAFPYASSGFGRITREQTHQTASTVELLKLR